MSNEAVFEVIKDVLLLLAGVGLTLMTQEFARRRSERRKKIQAYETISRLTEAISKDVAHGHDFSHKNEWSQELKRVAEENGAWLGTLNEPITRLSWQIRDRSFDHEQRDAENYCCDEVLADLSTLQLQLWPHIEKYSGFSKVECEAHAKKLLRVFLLNTLGAIDDETVEREYLRWKSDEDFLLRYRQGREVGRPIKWSNEQ